MAFQAHEISVEVARSPKQARARIREAIKSTKTLQEAADRLGVSRRTLVRYRKRLRLS